MSTPNSREQLLGHSLTHGVSQETSEAVAGMLANYREELLRQFIFLNREKVQNDDGVSYVAVSAHDLALTINRLRQQP